jgi:hypothetical protein
MGKMKSIDSREKLHKVAILDILLTNIKIAGRVVTDTPLLGGF